VPWTFDWFDYSVRTANWFIWGQQTDDNNRLQIYYALSGKVRLDFYNSGVQYYIDESTGDTTQAFIHHAVSFDGTTYRIFRAGILTASSALSNAVPINMTGDIYIGTYQGTYNIEYDFNGYMSNYRFTKGVALWIRNFTPPNRLS
jgi:hypothetical protein